METTENVIQYTISEHCKQRYAERIMGKEDNDIKRFIIQNEEKIKVDINKLIHYGVNIYTGKQSQKDGKGSVVDVYLKDCWVVLVDNRTKNVITLYKIDLGLDEEFNKAYVSRMVEKLNGNKEMEETVRKNLEEESNTYKQMIEGAEIQIKEYRAAIKNLEELCVAYKTIIENNGVKLSQAQKEVTGVLNTLIGKRTF